MSDQPPANHSELTTPELTPTPERSEPIAAPVQPHMAERPPLGEYDEMVRREAMQKQHNDRITLLVTIVSTFVAVIAAAAAVWSSYEAHSARIQDERPFVAVDVTARLVNDRPQPGMAITTTFEAFGKTPARNVTIRCRISENSDELDAFVRHPGNLTGVDYAYILPSRSLTDPCYPSHPFFQHHPQLLDVYGIVTYHDDAGRAYQTPFCFIAAIIGGGQTSTPQEAPVHTCMTDRWKLPPLK
jgi:hypothetical protein